MSNDTSTSWKTWLGFIVLVAVTSALCWYFIVDTQAAEVQDPNSTVPPIIAFAKADDNAKVAAPEDVTVTAEEGVKNIAEGTETVSGVEDSNADEDSSDTGADSASADQDADKTESASSETSESGADQKQASAAEPATNKSDAMAEDSGAGAKETAAAPAQKKPATPVRVVTAKDVNIKTQQSDSGVKYVTGGIGQDEILYMLSAFNDYSFKLTNFRNQGKRAYLSNVKVQINDDQGKPVLSTTTKGPFLYADLPAGDYQVKADYEGQSQSEKVSVSKSSQKSVTLKWKDSDSDSSSAKASDAKGSSSSAPSEPKDASSSKSSDSKDSSPTGPSEGNDTSSSKASDSKDSSSTEPSEGQDTSSSESSDKQ